MHIGLHLCTFVGLSQFVGVEMSRLCPRPEGLEKHLEYPENGGERAFFPLDSL